MQPFFFWFQTRDFYRIKLIVCWSVPIIQYRLCQSILFCFACSQDCRYNTLVWVKAHVITKLCRVQLCNKVLPHAIKEQVGRCDFVVSCELCPVLVKYFDLIKLNYSSFLWLFYCLQHLPFYSPWRTSTSCTNCSRWSGTVERGIEPGYESRSNL